MPERRNPAEEKAVDYKKQRVNIGQYPHLQRRAWPKKKALRNQTFRRLEDRALRAALEQADQVEDVSPDRIFRKKSDRRASGNIPLGERIAYARPTRMDRLGWNFFKQAYSTEKHRLTFGAFLAAIIAADGPNHRDTAELFQELLDPQLYIPGHQSLSRRVAPQIDPRAWGQDRSDWLWRFLADEPACEARLRTWISAVLASTTGGA